MHITISIPYGIGGIHFIEYNNIEDFVEERDMRITLLREALIKENIPLEILPGAEVFLSDRVFGADNLDELTIVSGNKIRPTASIKMNIEDKEVIEADVGIGPVDAAINAVKEQKEAEASAYRRIARVIKSRK